jgi:ferric-dicitrate binding protein FerR (iron transport regulator)
VFRPDGRDLWAFSTGPVAHFHDRWFTDARAVCVQLGDAGQVKGWMLVGGSRITLNGEPIVELDRRVRAATLRMVNGRRTIELSEPANLVSSPGESGVRKVG